MVSAVSETGATILAGVGGYRFESGVVDETGATIKPGYALHSIGTRTEDGNIKYTAYDYGTIALDNHLQYSFGGCCMERPDKGIDTALSTGDSITSIRKGEVWGYIPAGYDVYVGEAIRAVANGFARYPDTGGYYRQVGHAMEYETGASWARLYLNGGG